MKSILFVGGTRSGKSSLAEKWTISNGKKCLFIATALVEDEEIRKRVHEHQQRRGAAWQCLEAPFFVPQHVEAYAVDVILMDCLSMWLNNRMARGDNDKEILSACDTLSRWIQNLKIPIAIVSSELGQGMVPMSELARRYRDLHGLMNQSIAQACQNVLFISCGLPLCLKGKIPSELQI